MSDLNNLLNASDAMTSGTAATSVWYEESQQAIITIANEIASKVEVTADTDDHKIELVVQQYVDWLGSAVKELAITTIKDRKSKLS